MSLELTAAEKSRLSKKAQRYIEVLEREGEIARRKIKELNDLHYNQGDSRISYSEGIGPDILLPTQARVQFSLTGADGTRERLSVAIEDDRRLRVSSDFNSIVTAQQSSNVTCIIPADFRKI